MSLLARLLRRFGYFRVSDYGLVVTESGHVLRVGDGAIVNAAPALPPRFQAPTPPGGTLSASPASPKGEPGSAIRAPIFPMVKTVIDPFVSAPESEVHQTTKDVGRAQTPQLPLATRPRLRIPPPPVPRRMASAKVLPVARRPVTAPLTIAPTARTVIDRSLAEDPATRGDVRFDSAHSQSTDREATVVNTQPFLEAHVEPRKPRELLPRLSRRLAKRKRAG